MEGGSPPCVMELDRKSRILIHPPPPLSLLALTLILGLGLPTLVIPDLTISLVIIDHVRKALLPPYYLQ